MGIEINNYPRIQQPLKNAEANILFLASLSDKKLAEKLETIHLQSEIAEQKNIQHSMELLEIWRSQLIAARIYKAENEIPDAPDEIRISIADIETFAVKLEQRKELLNEAAQHNQPDKEITDEAFLPKNQQAGDNQLSIF